MGQSAAARRRRSIRLPKYAYARPGAYFVTICSHERRSLFGVVAEDDVRLNAVGEIVGRCWGAIPEHFPHIALDAFVVMPNHVHGILFVIDRPVATVDVGAQHAAPLPTPEFHAVPVHAAQRFRVAPGSLGAIVRSFKSAATREINRVRGTPGQRVWQRNYYEHVIRNDAALERLRRDIADNPRRWAEDPENPDRPPRQR